MRGARRASRSINLLGVWWRNEREARMGKWTERSAIAAVLIVVVVTGVGMYAKWRDCTRSGGTTVRGLFGLESIK